MSEAYIAGRGLACALGDDLAQALRALRAGGVAPAPFQINAELSTPYLAIPPITPSVTPSVAPKAADWHASTRTRVLDAAAQSGALATSRRGALFLATTSFDLGARELQQTFEGDAATFAVSFAEQVALWLAWQGPVFTVCTACTSAINALLSAQALIRAGDVADALVLGLELGNRYTLGGFLSMQLLASAQAQPLGAARDGLVLGDAIAALYLSARPARWRLCGGANVVDNSDPAGATAAAVAAMARQALAASGITPAQVDLIKLQAAGSPNNDATELQGLRQVFPTLPALVSLKRWLGHTLGAAGAAETALLTACIEAGLWPAPGYALDPVLGAAFATQAPTRLRHVLAVVLGFGGGHAAVVIEDLQAARP